jgi:MFS superfamily sulfate permease-like transporter
MCGWWRRRQRSNRCRRPRICTLVEASSSIGSAKSESTRYFTGTDCGAAGRWCAPWDRSGRLRADILTGLPGAISSMPDAMAAAVLAGANPVQGLSGSFAGPSPAGSALTPG